MDDGGVQGASGSPANKASSKLGKRGEGERWSREGEREREEGRKKNGKERQSRDCRLIYGGFPFNEIVSVTEPVKGP